MTKKRCLECELSWAVQDEDLAAVRARLAEGADPGSEKDCNTALFDAIAQDSAEILGALLDAGAEPVQTHPVTGQTPLAAALDGALLGVLRELARRGVDPRSASLASLVRAADRPELVGRALAARIDLDTADPETGRTALHEAATYGYERTVRRLLEEGADPAIRDTWGNTAATLAKRNHHDEVAQLLAEASPKPE